MNMLGIKMQVELLIMNTTKNKIKNQTLSEWYLPDFKYERKNCMCAKKITYTHFVSCACL